MRSPSPSYPARLQLPTPPVRPRPVAVPVGTVTAAGVAAGAVGLVLGAAAPVIVLSSLVTSLAVIAGWVADRVVGVGLTARRERTRFLRALGDAEEVVARLRAGRARELADWYPTSDRIARADVAGRPARALVLGVGRASSGFVLDGRPEDDLEPDDPARARLARLRAEAATLDEAPLCVSLGSTVRVVGPPVVAEAVAAGLRRQLRSAGASEAEAADAVEHVLVPGTVGEPHAAEAATPPVDTIVLIGPDGEATVTLKDGQPCRQPLRVAFVSVREA